MSWEQREREPHPICRIWGKIPKRGAPWGLIIKDEWELSRNMASSRKNEEHRLHIFFKKAKIH